MRTKIIMVLAVLMGLLTTALFYKYMKQFDDTPADAVELVDIVTAAQPIKKNEIISASMLVTSKVPEQGLHPNVLRKAEDAIGKYATADIEQGEAILPHRLMSAQEESLFVSRKVRKGYRAVSVGVNFVQSVSNLIEPEDRVDVIESWKDRVTQEVYTEVLLRDVRLLAVGRRMIESAEGDEYFEYSSATLELTEQDAVKVVHAIERGIVHLAIHSRIVQSLEGSKALPKGESTDDQ